LEYSEDFTNLYWGKLNSTITPNNTISPDGTQNADKFVENNGTGEKWIYTTPTVTTGSVYTYSIFAKKGERDFIYINGYSNGNFRAWFNLNTGTIGATDAGVSAKIENYGNGWYKCSVTITAVIGVQFYLLGVSNANNVVDYSGNGTSGIYIWGAQAEQSSYPTSYIPTTTASATRVADECFKTGISSLIGQTEGVWFADYVLNGQTNNANILNSEKNTTCALFMSQEPDGDFNAGLYINGSLVGYIVAPVGLTVGQRVKVAYAYKSGSFALYINGNQEGILSSTFTFPTTLDDIFLNDETYFNYKEAVKYNQVALFKTRLTNAELASLTTI
jgi:hypothetical protein